MSLMLGAMCLEFVSGSIWMSGSFIVSSSPSHELWSDDDGVVGVAPRPLVWSAGGPPTEA